MNINRNFPNNAITKSVSISGADVEVVASSVSAPYTILGIDVKQSGTSSDTAIMCGSEVVAVNYGSNLAFIPMNYLCADSIIVDKTGVGDSSTTVITYVNYDMTTREDLNFDGLHLFLGFFLFFMIFFNVIRYFKTWIRH